MLPFPVCHWGGGNDPHFDGLTYLTHEGGLSGVSDSSLVLLSFHIRDSSNNGDFIFALERSDGFGEGGLKFEGSKLVIFFKSSGAPELFECSSTIDLRNTNEWKHFLYSSNGGSQQMYVDDVDVTNIRHTHGNALNFTPDRIRLGSLNTGHEFEGCMQEFWLDFGVSLDLSVASNRRKMDFGKLGDSGEAPTGAAPAMFFKGAANGFATNKGNGGSFTLTGTLGSCVEARSST